MTKLEKVWLDALLANDPDRTGKSMTDWEVQFVEDLNQRQDKPLSDKQRDVLKRIYWKVCV